MQAKHCSKCLSIPSNLQEEDCSCDCDVCFGVSFVPIEFRDDNKERKPKGKKLKKFRHPGER